MPLVETGECHYQLQKWFDSSPELWAKVLVMLTTYAAATCHVDSMQDLAESLVQTNNILDVLASFCAIDQVFNERDAPVSIELINHGVMEALEQM